MSHALRVSTYSRDPRCAVALEWTTRAGGTLGALRRATDAVPIRVPSIRYRYTVYRSLCQ